MHELPMNRWYVSRWIFRTTADDFRTAVQSTQDAMEHMTKRKFDLKVTFYRAADPAALELPDAPAPDIEVSSVDKLSAIRNRDWNNAHRVVAQLTLRPEATGTGKMAMPALYTHATISAGWPDSGRIDFEVQPKDNARPLTRHILDKHFTFWNRGLNLD